MLRFINKNWLMYAFSDVPVSVVLIMHLCLVISNGSRECSYVFKRITNQLPSLDQKWLNSLAPLCIDNKIVEKLDTNNIINSFALSKFTKNVI